MILIQKIIRGLTTQIENQLKSLNEMYRYSTQNNPCFSNFIFSRLPNLSNSSYLIDDIIMANKLSKDINSNSIKDDRSEKLIFEHFLDYTVNCFDQIFFDFYSKEKMPSASDIKQGKPHEIVSFFDLVRLNFYSSILSILTSQNNVNFLIFSPSMYSSFLKKFPDFLSKNITLAFELGDYDKSHPLYIHGYNSIQNVLNSLSRLDIDIFKDYLDENDSKGGINLSKICDAATLLVQNEQSLLSFTKDLTMMIGISSSSIEKSDFLAKLYQFFMNLFMTNPELYIRVIQSNDEIKNNINVFFIQVLQSYHIDINSPISIKQDFSTNEYNNVLPILSILLPFLAQASNIGKYKDFVFNNFINLSEKLKIQSSREMIFNYLNSYLALFQSTLITPDSKSKIPSIVEFVDSQKSNFDSFLFKFENSDNSNSNSISEVINSTPFLFNILPRYLALDIAKSSNDYDEESSTFYSITQSVSFCTQSSNIHCSMSLIHGLSLLVKGYPFKEIKPIAIQIILNVIFNVVDMYKSPTLPTSNSANLNAISTSASVSLALVASSSLTTMSNSPSLPNLNSSFIQSSPSSSNVKLKDNSYSFETVDDLHRNIYELISGHTFCGSGYWSNEFDLIPTFLDLIASESSTSLAFYHFMINEVRMSILSENDQKNELKMNVSDFSPDTIASFFILLIATFDKPSRWSIFSLESINTNRFLKNVNTALLKLYKDILKKNVTALFCFDTVMVKYLAFVKEIVKISKSKVSVDQFIDDVERILLLMNATSDKLNSELANQELSKMATEFNVPFLYQWPLKFSSRRASSSHNELIVKSDVDQISTEKLKGVKSHVLLPTMKFCYLFWFESTFRYLYNNGFIVSMQPTESPTQSNQISIAGWKLKSDISFQIIIRISSFLCLYSTLIDEIQPLLTKHPIFKNAKIKFANAYLDFISHDIKDEVFILITNSVSLFDSYTSNMLLKIIRSNLLSSSDSFSFSKAFITLIPNGSYRFKSIVNENNTNSCLSLHSNCYSFISELINEDCLFYNDQSYNICEEIILNLITIISMDQKFKLNNNEESQLIPIKSILFSISNIIYKFYSFNPPNIKSSQIARLSIISTILNYMISTRNIMFSVIIAKPLPRLFKDFVITAENEISGSVSNYENVLFIRKTIDNFFSFFFLILSSNDKSSLFSVCQESLENILLANYKEAAEIFVSSLLNYSKSDLFSKVILKSFISVIKKKPQIIKENNSPYYYKLNVNSIDSIIRSNINSIEFYEALIEIYSYNNKLRHLFVEMCSKYKKIDDNDGDFYERINCPYFFISFFKIAATSSFINSFSVFLFKMSVEKTVENLLPPIQFVYYWQLFCRITNEDPFVVLDKFLIRPIFLQPHLYGLNPNLNGKMNQSCTTNTIIQCNTFISKLQNYSGLKLYLDHLSKNTIEYCEVYPTTNSNKPLNSHSILFHFLSEVPNPGNFITFSKVLFDKSNTEIAEMNKFDLSRIVYEFIQSQCLVCIDKDKNKNKKNWLLNLDKIPENSIQIIHECFRVLLLKSIENNLNDFSTFYEESNIKLNQNESQLNSIENRSSSLHSKSSDYNEISTSSSKPLKKRFSKPFFKIKSHAKKDKSEDKKNSKLIKNLDDDDDDEKNIFNQITLYVNMRKLPSNYLNILEVVFDMKINLINLIFTPIGILHEIESEIINKSSSTNNNNNSESSNKNFDHVKVISNVDSINDDIIFPFHLSTTKIQFNCLVNNNPGSIGFFQECIVITSFEHFRGQLYQVSTVSSYAQFRLPKIISKTAIEIEFNFQFDKSAAQSSIITSMQGKKANSIVLDFDLTEKSRAASDVDENVFTKVSPEFIIEAMQSSTGSTIGDQKAATIPLSITSDPAISLIALSLFYIPNNDSIVSETALDLFWLIINAQSKDVFISNSLNLPLDGFIRVLQSVDCDNGCQENTLFCSVVQYLSHYLSIPKKESMQMMPFLSLTSAFISTSNDQPVLSGICHNLLLQFNQKSIVESSPNDPSESSSSRKLNENTMNDYFQLLQIWSTVRSSSFTTIALPQILISVQSSVCQSQLIHCLTAKNRKVVNEVLIENLLYKDLISFRLYNPICSNGLYKIFPLIQFIGKPEIILFLNLAAVLTAPNETAKSFISSIKSFIVYYRKNKELISQSSDFNIEMDEINDDDNSSSSSNAVYMTPADFNLSTAKAAAAAAASTEPSAAAEDGNEGGALSDSSLSSMFDPEKSNIFHSAKKILSIFDKNLQESVSNLFESLTKSENSKVWHLKPSLSTAELLDAMTDSIVPELNLKKLSFCIATFSNHKKHLYCLFWVALPYLISQYSHLRKLAINFISSIFNYACKENDENPIDPFDEFMKVLNEDKNLQFLIRTFGDQIGINFEENLPIAFASILIGIMLKDDKNKSSINKLINSICQTFKKFPSKAMIFVFIMIVFTNKVTANFIHKFNIKSDSSDDNHFVVISNYFKEAASSSSKFEIMWILNLIVWAFSQPAVDNSKYQMYTIVLYEIMKVRTDLPKLLKSELIKHFLKFTDNKDQKVQEYLAFIFAIANSSQNDENVIEDQQSTNAQKSSILDQLEKLLWAPKQQDLVEKHLYSFCVNFHGAIKSIINAKS